MTTHFTALLRTGKGGYGLEVSGLDVRSSGCVGWTSRTLVRRDKILPGPPISCGDDLVIIGYDHDILGGLVCLDSL